MSTSRIVTFQEQSRTHYHLRGCGPLRPLTEAQARQLRREGVEIELPDTMPLAPLQVGCLNTAVSTGGQDAY